MFLSLYFHIVSIVNYKLYIFIHNITLKLHSVIQSLYQGGVTLSLGLNISKIRIDAKLNQRELAKKLGVSAGAVGLWETDKRLPDAHMIVKIAQYFDVSTDYLLGLSSSPNAKEVIHGEQLSTEEKEIVEAYRAMNADGKRILLGKALDLKLSTATTNRKKDIG